MSMGNSNFGAVPDNSGSPSRPDPVIRTCLQTGSKALEVISPDGHTRHCLDTRTIIGLHEQDDSGDGYAIIHTIGCMLKTRCAYEDIAELIWGSDLGNLE